MWCKSTTVQRKPHMPAKLRGPFLFAYWKRGNRRTRTPPRPRHATTPRDHATRPRHATTRPRHATTPRDHTTTPPRHVTTPRDALRTAYHQRGLYIFHDGKQPLPSRASEDGACRLSIRDTVTLIFTTEAQHLLNLS